MSEKLFKQTLERLIAGELPVAHEHNEFVGHADVVGKLLEAKHVGKGTFSDVGTTYKMCRRNALQRLLPHLNPAVNLEFNAHFLDTALGSGLDLVECPITFHQRVGVSKGGNVDTPRALKVGLRMMVGLFFRWDWVSE